MISVRVWNLRSDRDAEAVRFLENTFLRFRHLAYLAIRTARRSALRKCHRKGVPVSRDLRKPLQYYLAQDDYIIFVVDPNGQQRRGSKLLVDQLRQIVKDGNFSDKVFFSQIFRNGIHLYHHNGKALFRVFTPKLKVSVNGFGKNGIEP